MKYGSLTSFVLGGFANHPLGNVAWPGMFRIWKDDTATERATYSYGRDLLVWSIQGSCKLDGFVSGNGQCGVSVVIGTDINQITYGAGTRSIFNMLLTNDGSGSQRAASDGEVEFTDAVLIPANSAITLYSPISGFVQNFYASISLLTTYA